MLRTFFNKKSAVLISVCVVLIVAVTICLLPQKGISDDKSFLQMSDADRRQAAQQRYSTFSKNPDAVSEVLISFDNATSSDVLDILPHDIEVVACFHYYDTGDKVAGGGYFGCKDKTVSQVMSDYYQSIYNMIKNSISTSNKRVKYLNNQINYLGSKGSDVMELQTKLSNVTNQLQIDLRQLDEMEHGNFMISGIRIKTDNATLSALTSNDKIYCIEIIDNGLEKMGVGMVNPVILCD